MSRPETRLCWKWIGEGKLIKAYLLKRIRVLENKNSVLYLYTFVRLFRGVPEPSEFDGGVGGGGGRVLGWRSELPTVTGDARFRSGGRITSGTDGSCFSPNARGPGRHVGRPQRLGKSCPDKYDCVGSTAPENTIAISSEIRSNIKRTTVNVRTTSVEE